MCSEPVTIQPFENVLFLCEKWFVLEGSVQLGCRCVYRQTTVASRLLPLKKKKALLHKKGPDTLS